MILSLQDTTVTLNGHTVESAGKKTNIFPNGLDILGWSEDSAALTLPDSFEFASVRRGASGDMAAFSTGDKGGPVSLKLLPNSPSVPFLMQQVTLILQEDAVVVWHGNVKHTKSGISVALERGILVSGPLWYTMGKGEVGNLTFTWEFEQIIPKFDGVSFPHLPIAAANGG